MKESPAEVPKPCRRDVLQERLNWRGGQLLAGAPDGVRDEIATPCSWSSTTSEVFGIPATVGCSARSFGRSRAISTASPVTQDEQPCLLVIGSNITCHSEIKQRTFLNYREMFFDQKDDAENASPPPKLLGPPGVRVRWRRRLVRRPAIFSTCRRNGARQDWENCGNRF